VDIRKIISKRRRILARSLLDRVGILNKEDDLPASLSGGHNKGSQSREALL
jgi:ABC-type polar amino acid transport system ATPase subunit